MSPQDSRHKGPAMWKSVPYYPEVAEWYGNSSMYVIFIGWCHSTIKWSVLERHERIFIFVIVLTILTFFFLVASDINSITQPLYMCLNKEYQSLNTRHSKHEHGEIYQTGSSWIPHTKGQCCGALVLSLVLAWPTVKQTVESPVVWDAMSFMWRHCNAILFVNLLRFGDE